MSKPTYAEIAEVIKGNPVRVQRIEGDPSDQEIFLNKNCPYFTDGGYTLSCGSHCMKFEGKIITTSGRIECWCHYHELPHLLCEIHPGGE